MTNPDLLPEVFGRLVDLLAASSTWGAVFVATVWAVCRAVPRLPAGIKATLWWLACARLVVGLVWVTPIALPVLPASSAPPPLPTRAAAPGGEGTAPTDLAASIQSWRSPRSHEVGRQAEPAVSVVAALPWRPLLGLAWLFAVAGFAVRAVRAFRRQRLVVARSCRLDPGEVPDLVRFPIGRSGLGRMLAAGEGLPEIRTSTEITSPQLVWVGRPVVLVPRTLADRGGDALAWAVCHELVHLRRRDHWSGLVVHVAERLFFFHPLARVAAREFLVCREIACDAEVVRSMDAPPRDYGRLLVTLGVHGGRSRLAVAGAASSLHALKRRLIMLQHVPSSAPSRWWRLVAVIAIAGSVPVQLVARRTSEPGAAVNRGSGLLGTIADRAAPLSVEDVATPADGLGQVPPPPRPPPPPPAPPPPPPDGHDFAFTSSDDGESWAYVSGHAKVMVNGSSARSARIEALSREGAPVFWFERGGKEYVIRDAATLKQIEARLAPVQDMGTRQGRLGAKQGELGAKQAALGAKQADTAAKQAALAAQAAGLAAQQMKRDRSPEAMAKAEADLEAHEKALEAELAKLERELEPLGEQQDELAKLQEELGREQEALARAQADASKRSQQQLRAILDEAIRKGTATVVK